jgi:ornithine cyclodeaminase/alanine dehydrogenase-like protein (mu-crystallin family)
LDDEVMRTCYLVAESRDCVGRESGDVVGSGATIDAEIGDILARPEAAAIPKSGRVLFKTVGMAIEDLTAARLVWRRSVHSS